MHVLRLKQETRGANEFRVEVEVEQEDAAPQTAVAAFTFDFGRRERERLRWYLEAYAELSDEPAQQMAGRVEGAMQTLGARLFQAVFDHSRDTMMRWGQVAGDLAHTRVEIITGVAGAAALPWELLFDPHTGSYLALQSHSFVRSHRTAARTPRVGEAAERVHILLAICRPGGREDVPFRSVAMRLLKGLTEEQRAAYRLDVLRPPTFEALAQTLRDAHRDGEPYHVLHFDGHGAFLDVGALFQKWEEEASREEAERMLADLLDFEPHVLSPREIYKERARAGRRGYLLFENPDGEHNARLVGGPELGNLLAETGVRALVLNACRSAHAEAPPPEEEGEGGAGNGDAGAEGAAPQDVHEQVRALGSLAHEVSDAGVAGVVAMQYNIYVETAARFVAGLYEQLARGRALGEAVSLGRRALNDDPLRAIAGEPVRLQDWPVPVVYEAAPLRLFPRPLERAGDLHLEPAAGQMTVAAGALDDAVRRATPDAGFFGRDDALLALDRAFDRHRVVLLHGYAGSGKTTTAAEFARWYAQTGGVAGPVLFTSFEQHTPLPRVLDRIEELFGPQLAQQGVHWLALDDDWRREVALRVLRQIPVLWIWDNVEPVAGFPAGAESAWSEEEQADLAAFLRAARETRARFLLTSRRKEEGWLGDLPRRVPLPPMPRRERLQLARALAEKAGKRLDDARAWRPLLDYTEGNPLTLTVVVKVAVRQGLADKEGEEAQEAVEAFVRRLRAGEVDLGADDEALGRDKSLAASLAYGFQQAFGEGERRRLALLHFFQGFVDVDVQKWMGAPDMEWRLPAIEGLGRDDWIDLLERAAGVGLLTAYGGGFYRIHPALPWFFKNVYDRYDDRYDGGAGDGQGAGPARAFVEAMGELGNYYHNQFGAGNRDVVGALQMEEANLLHARRLARASGWWDALTSTMQGLRALYDFSGRRAEWAQLVEEIVPDFVDPETDGPRPGRDEEWSVVTGYRVRLARERRAWSEAERLQRLRVQWNRERAAAALEKAARDLSAAERNAVRTLAVSVEQLGHLLRERGEAACVEAYEEALALFEQIEARPEAAVVAFNLGHAYKNLPALRDLDAAESWYQRSLALRAEEDGLGRGKCMITLGNVALERFDEARAAGAEEDALRERLNEALRRYRQALDLLPAGAVDDLAVAHSQMGSIYAEAGRFDRALGHYRQSIRYFESAGNRYGAAQTRYNVAVTLFNAGQLLDARDYAHAALRDYQPYGPGAAADIEKAQRLLAAIEEALAA